MVGNQNNWCRISYIDNAIFHPSKIKLVLVLPRPPELNQFEIRKCRFSSLRDSIDFFTLTAALRILSFWIFRCRVCLRLLNFIPFIFDINAKKSSIDSPLYSNNLSCWSWYGFIGLNYRHVNLTEFCMDYREDPSTWWCQISRMSRLLKSVLRIQTVNLRWWFWSFQDFCLNFLCNICHIVQRCVSLCFNSHSQIQVWPSLRTRGLPQFSIINISCLDLIVGSGLADNWLCISIFIKWIV